MTMAGEMPAIEPLMASGFCENYRNICRSTASAIF